MHEGKYVFAQIVDSVSHYELDTCIAEYNGDKGLRSFFCRDQFLAMMFGQLSHRESLRDIVVTLNAHKSKLYHLGFRSDIKLSTLARANENRSYQIYEKLAKMLIKKARKLYSKDPEFPFQMDNNLYIIDSSTIDLCLGFFGWATFRATKSAVKIHTQIDGRGIIPLLTDITEASVHDVNFLDKLVYEEGAYYIMDRGYLDYGRMYKITQAGAFFVTRAKSTTAFKRLYSNTIDKRTGLRADQVILFTVFYARKRYPSKLRRIKYFDEETHKYYVFLTNDMNADALTIARMYKYRWEIELFFKWIKQNLKIISFWGHSANAVKVQIYTAICTYLTVLIIKKELQIQMEEYKILQILSVSLFDKTPIKTLFLENNLQREFGNSSKQLSLSGF